MRRGEEGEVKGRKGAIFLRESMAASSWGEVDGLDYILWVNCVKLTDGDLFNEVKNNCQAPCIRTGWVVV